MEISTKTSNDIYIDVRQASEKLFGLHFSNPRPLILGLLNLKWRVETEKGEYVLKQFSKERYERFGLEKVAQEQEMALREQLRLHESGIPCPNVLTRDVNIIHISPNGERFVVMEFMPGENLLPGTLNEDQMYSLGQVTAHLHNTLNDGTLPVNFTAKFVPPSVEQRMEHWKAVATKVKGNERVMALVDRQMRATEQFDIEMIGSCEPGWAHRDLWVDNILFVGNEVSAILDFDRVAFDYPEMDVARAIMSGALHGDHFNISAARAFLDGYRTKRDTQKGMLVRSLHLLWYFESVGWIGTDLNRDRYQEVQFETEMVWLADHLEQLKSIVGEY